MLAELTRKTDFTCSLAPVAPFIYVGMTGRHVFVEEWGDTLGDVVTQTGPRRKIVLVSRDFVNEYSAQLSYEDMELQPGSFWFDRANELIYIHTELNASPVVSVFNYGYAFGVTTGVDVIYIGDYKYAPVLKSIPDIEQTVDTVGLDKPTGMTGSAVLSNLSEREPGSVRDTGILDFLISESVYGNDFKIYDDSENPVGTFKVENVSIGMKEMTLNLQDKRIK